MNRSEHGFLAALQFADSALPIGRFAHSYGLEAFLDANPDTGEEDLREVVESLVLRSAAPLDGAAIWHSHAAAEKSDLAALMRLDRIVTAKKLTEGARRASSSCGRQQAALGAEITSSAVLHNLCQCIGDGRTDGNLAIVTGTIAAALGVGPQEAVLMELRGVAAAVCSAAVRLGCLSAVRAQVLLNQCHDAVVEGASLAETLSPEEMWSAVPELDLHVLRHRLLEIRNFLT